MPLTIVLRFVERRHLHITCTLNAKKKRKYNFCAVVYTCCNSSIQNKYALRPIFLQDQDQSAWLWNLYRTISKFCQPILLYNCHNSEFRANKQYNAIQLEHRLIARALKYFTTRTCIVWWRLRMPRPCWRSERRPLRRQCSRIACWGKNGERKWSSDIRPHYPNDNSDMFQHQVECIPCLRMWELWDSLKSLYANTSLEFTHQFYNLSRPLKFDSLGLLLDVNCNLLS